MRKPTFPGTGGAQPKESLELPLEAKGWTRSFEKPDLGGKGLGLCGFRMLGSRDSNG